MQINYSLTIGNGFNMNKNILKKIACELNIELKGNIKIFIFMICSRYLKKYNILDKDLWLKKYFDVTEKINNKTWKLLDDYCINEFYDIEDIGWLYQYFISSEKARVFNNLKNNIKVEKADIPYATQLFTPDWIVKYLVQNSLGRFTKSSDELEYFVPLKEKEILENKKLEEIKFIDPCCGTGNILIYGFDLFFENYVRNGFSKDEAIYNILTKNLYGIDIDEIACKICRIVLIFKALTIDNNIFNKDYINNMNIICIKNSSGFDKEKYGEIVDFFEDADEFGSLLKPYKINLPKSDGKIDGLLKQYKILNQKYDVVCTNPPYMGKKNINNKLSTFLKNEYPKTKSEMYSAFIERCLEFTNKNGYLAMITIHSWMFISSFKDLRDEILKSGTIINMLHTGAATFSDLSSFNALATSFVFKKEKINIDTCFIRLSNYYNLKEKIDNFKNLDNYYYLNQNRFYEIPNQPFIYWISENIRNCFKDNKKLNDFYQAKQGLATGNNKEFVRFWFEVPFSEIGQNYKSSEDFLKSGKIYSPFNKGGIFRKWYGNFEYVIKFNEENYLKLLGQGNHLPSRKYYFQKGITWSLFGFENFGVRFKDFGYVFDVSGSSMFPKDDDLYYIIGYLCSNVCFKFLSCLAPTVNFQVGNIASLPFKLTDNINLRKRIDKLVEQNIEICKEEWSFYETSIEFKSFPLLIDKFKSENLENTLNKFEKYYNNIRDNLRKNEEELNKIYSDIFNVKDEIDFSVNDRDLTLKKFDKKEVIIMFLSYIVGCSVGRYDYKANIPNYDKCSYIINFDTVENKLKEVLMDVFNEESLEDNIKLITQILEVKSIRNYYEKYFFKDHEKQYQGHPIYFLK